MAFTQFLLSFFFGLQALLCFALLLFTDSPQRFGWQMYSRPRLVSQVTAHRDEKKMDLTYSEKLFRVEISGDELNQVCLCGRANSSISYKFFNGYEQEERALTCPAL